MDEFLQANLNKQVRRYNIYDDDDYHNERVNVHYDETDQQLAQPIQDEDIFADTINDKPSHGSPPRTPRIDEALTPKERMKQNLADQVKRLGLMPKKIDSSQRFIELPCRTPSKQVQIVNPSRKSTIEKFFLPAKRPVDTITPEKKFVTREQHIRSLEKKICADKRKIWDSTRVTIDDYDEEEQNIAKSESEDDEIVSIERKGIDNHEKMDDDSDDNQKVIDDDESNDSDDNRKVIDDEDSEDSSIIGFDDDDEKDERDEQEAESGSDQAESIDEEEVDHQEQKVDNADNVRRFIDDEASDVTSEVEFDDVDHGASDDSDVGYRPRLSNNRIFDDDDSGDNNVAYQLDLDD